MRGLSSKFHPLIPLKSIFHYSWMTRVSKEIDVPLSPNPPLKKNMELNPILFRDPRSLPPSVSLCPFFLCCTLSHNYLSFGLFCLTQIAIGNQVPHTGGCLDHQIPSFYSQISRRTIAALCRGLIWGGLLWYGWSPPCWWGISCVITTVPACECIPTGLVLGG